MTESDEVSVEKPVRIDIVSDVVCPWCIVGYKQLERAQAETAVPAVVYWHPFELNPDMPEEGQNLVEHITAKYGTTPEASRRARAKLTALGAELGFTFDYVDDMRMVNTFRAHQLLHWAASHGLQHQLKMALFSAYFSQWKDVNDPAVLAETTASVGLDRTEAAAVLSDARFADQVRQHEAFWTSRGVQGVPAMIFDGREALIGAQGVDSYRTMLLRHAGERADIEDA
ncbi:MAG: DsbA family oxidoreductase [Alphaproteobacteria bacterium]